LCESSWEYYVAKDFILYHPDLAPRLGSFGFDIPLEDGRSTDVFNNIKEKHQELIHCSINDLEMLNEDDLKLAHSSDYIELFANKEDRSKELKRIYQADPSIDLDDEAFMESLLLQVSGTYHALQMSLKSEFTFFLGGGMHHASTEQGDGFCPFNDIVIAARKAQKELGLSKVLVIDTDAHKGDGTAEITCDDDSITTLSIHMKKGWPMPCHTPGAAILSNLDLAVGSGEEYLYLELLEQGLKTFENEDYDACFVIAGADAYKLDGLDSTVHLRLSREQMLQRDILVFKFLKEKKIPQTWLMAGGYGPHSHEIYEQFLFKVIDLMR
jgi:acetoin utilization deacetylase AcuC-like enzyme